jgi:hypothetical protein
MAEPNPITPFPADIDRDDFGHWLSGFVDGEGCFRLYFIHQKRPGKVFHSPAGRFELLVRDDDRPAIELVRSYWGFGNLYTRQASGRARAATKLFIGRAADLVQLVRHFDRFPLRAKKARDFAIWREGVAVLAAVAARPKVGRVGVKGCEPRWSGGERERFAALAAALKDCRAYSSPPMLPLKFTLLGDVTRMTKPAPPGTICGEANGWM